MEKTIYIKFSEDRIFNMIALGIAKRFRYIKKSFYNRYKSDPNGQISEHLALMPEKHQWLVERYGDTAIDINDVKRTDKGMQFAFVSGESIQSKLDLYILQGNEKKVRQLLNEYVERLLRHGSYRGDFQPNADEQKIFGNVEMRDIDLAKVSNIDVIFPNVLVDEEKWHVIDYEWTFRFPVPCNFILYRMIHYYLESDGKRAVLREFDFYKKAGISEEELEIYAEMERNFQKYMEGKHVPLRSMYDEVSPGKVDVPAYYERIRAAFALRRLQVFYDRGSDFSEADSGWIFVLLFRAMYADCVLIRVRQPAD